LETTTILWIVLAFVIAFSAKKRGRSFGGFLVLSLLLSPVVGFIVLVIKGNNYQKNQRIGYTVYEYTNKKIYKNTNKNTDDGYRDSDDFYKDKGKNLSESIKKLPSNYVVIDIETTGLHPRKNKIIELSALKVRNDMIVDQFTTLCHPGTKISQTITKLTGITNDMLKGAPKINEVIQSYLDFIGDDIVIGHNAHFDINFIYANCIKLLEKPFSNDFVDTLKISRDACKDLRHHRVSDMVKYFNIIINGELHRSLNDCHATYQIYLKLKEAIKTKRY
jgi:DNA polymerase III epsilon subunit family exonuclease